MFENLFSKYPFFRYIPAILGMSLIFYSSSIPGSGMGWLHSPWDKFMHGSVYACLGFAFALCFRRSLWEEKKFFCLLSGFLLGALYGGLDEFHQSFVPGREAGASDWIADALGSLAGVFAYYFLAIKVGVFSQTKKL